VIEPKPVLLENAHVVLEPMNASHQTELIEAASDGELWNLWFTQVPTPNQAASYIQTALAGYEAGHMLPWVVRDNVVAAADRVEIGYTWYSASVQRSHVNTACKLLLLEHAFDTLGCKVVGLRTDNFNFRSQRAIEAIGAKRDGIIRHHALRKDGTVRDTYIYSILAHEWFDVRRHLEGRLVRLETR